MYLDELNGLIGKLNSRIKNNRALFGRNETATRYSLIDPLLCALGWDTADPAQVEPEFQSGSGRADYALKVGEATPSIIVEAKALGKNFGGGISQSIGYCIESGIEYFVITDGNTWRIYETHKPVPIGDKLLVEFSITGASHDAVMKMLWLWRGNFLTNQPKTPQLPPKFPPSTAPTGNGPANSEVNSLAQFAPTPGQRAPALVQFPDGIAKPIRRWFEVQLAVVEWLSETGRISVSDCPITDREGGVHLIHSQPLRRTGMRFRNPKAVNGFWIEAHQSARQHVDTAKRILASRGVSPNDVGLRKST